MPTSSSPHLLQKETLSWALNYKHYSHTVPWGVQTDIFIFFYAYSTMRHHGGFTSNLKKLPIISTLHGPFTAANPEAPVLRAEGPRGGGRWLCPNPTPSCDYKRTHTVDLSWPTSLPACLLLLYGCICCAFHSQQLHSSPGWCVPSSSSLHWAERQRGFLS